jgi:hypothetical protein
MESLQNLPPFVKGGLRGDFKESDVKILGGEGTHMKDEFLSLFEAAKDLVTYIDKEQVFDQAADMGCGGFDTYQSDAFYDLIAEARKALIEVEKGMNAFE